MNTRDLPGYGDTRTPFGYVPPNSPDYDDSFEAAIEEARLDAKALFKELDLAINNGSNTRAAAAADEIILVMVRVLELTR